MSLTFRLASAVALAVAALALPGSALAQNSVPVPVPGPVPWSAPGPAVGPVAYEPLLPPPRWGLHCGDTVGTGGTMIYGEVGWPDVSLGFQRGFSANVDVGFRASFIYAIEYVVPKKRNNNVTSLTPGLGLTIPVRFTLVRSDRVSVLVHADPGVKFDGFDPKVFGGPQLALGADLGLHVSEHNTLTLGVDLPLTVEVTPAVTGYVPLLMGLTFESLFTEHFGMSFNLRTGILHGVNNTGGDTDLALLAQVGFLGRL